MKVYHLPRTYSEGWVVCSTPLPVLISQAHPKQEIHECLFWDLQELGEGQARMWTPSEDSHRRNSKMLEDAPAPTSSPLLISSLEMPALWLPASPQTLS